MATINNFFWSGIIKYFNVAIARRRSKTRKIFVELFIAVDDEVDGN